MKITILHVYKNIKHIEGQCVLFCWTVFRNLLIKYEFPVMLLTMLLNNIVLNQNFTIKSETPTRLPLELYFLGLYQRQIKIIRTMKTEPGIANVCLQIQALQNKTSTYRKCSSLYIINRSETDLISSNDVGNFSSPLL